MIEDIIVITYVLKFENIICSYTLKVCDHSIYWFYKLLCIQCWIMFTDPSSITIAVGHFLEFLNVQELEWGNYSFLYVDSNCFMRKQFVDKTGDKNDLTIGFSFWYVLKYDTNLFTNTCRINQKCLHCFDMRFILTLTKAFYIFFQARKV